MINTKHLFISRRGRERGFGETDYFISRTGSLAVWLTKSLHDCVAKKNYPRLVIWLGKPNLAKGVGVKKAFCLRIIRPYVS